LIKDPLPASIEALQKLCLQQQLTIDVRQRLLQSKDNYIGQLEEKLSLLLGQRYQSRSAPNRDYQLQARRRVRFLH